MTSRMDNCARLLKGLSTNMPLQKLKSLHSINDSDSEIGFRFGDYMVAFEDGKINVYRSGKVIAQNTIEAFSRSPNAVFRLMQHDIKAANV